MSISEQEQKVLEETPAPAADRRRVARRERRRDALGRGPGDRREPLRDRRRDPRGRAGGARCRVRRAGRVGRDAAERARRRSSGAPSSRSTSAPTTSALLMTLEMGKAVAESKAEITYAAEFFRWFSGEALRIDGYYKNAGNGAVARAGDAPADRPLLLHHPLELPQRDGHAQDRPGGRRRLHDGDQARAADAAVDAGAGEAARRVRAAATASSTWSPARRRARSRSRSSATRGCASCPSPARPRSGSKLIAQAADNVLKVSMELGGNAPFLVFDDADVDDAVEGAMIAKMRNIGEACTSANRFHVAEGIADEFAEKLGERMGALKLGRGTEEGVDVGPLIDADQRDKVAELVADAVDKGATGLVGGSSRRRRRLLLRADGARRRPRRRPRATRGDLRPGRPGEGLRHPRRRRSPPPTTPSTASSPTSTPATSSARCASARGWRPG